MPERNTALGGRLSATGRGEALTLVEHAVAGAWLLVGWDPAVHERAGAAARCLGLGAAPEPGRGGAGERGLLAHIAPWRYLLVTASPDAAVALAAVIDTAAAIECRCARSWLQLQGAGARTLLDRETGADLRAPAFPAGAVAQLPIGRVDVLVHARSDDGFDLLPPRSFAASLVDWLVDAA